MFWNIREMEVLQRPCHEDVHFPKSGMPHPTTDGYSISVGEPKGQIEDYRKTIQNGKCIHLREYDTYYLAHWDIVNPHTNPLGHLLLDAPKWLFIGFLGAVFLSALLEE